MYICLYIYIFVYIYICMCENNKFPIYSCGYNCQWRSCQKDQTVQAQMKPRWM